MKQRTYKATGINLKAIHMGESDRMVTVLTKEKGLVRAIAPGARKHKSRLAGRSGLFVVNNILFTKGKSIDKLIQAETQRSFPGLSKDLAKLTASQYLAEIALAQALSDQPQEELFYLLVEHLGRLEAATSANVLACLAQATFHLLALAGVAPEVFRCCLSRVPLEADLSNSDWQVGFSVSSGGAIHTDEIERIERDRLQEVKQRIASQMPASKQSAEHHVAEAKAPYNRPDNNGPNAEAQPRRVQHKWPVGLEAKVSKEVARNLGIVTHLSAAELSLMQQLSKPELLLTPSTLTASKSSLTVENEDASTHFSPQSGTIKGAAIATSMGSGAESGPHANSRPHSMWRNIEKALRHYAQYQFDRPIRSAALIDTCFTPIADASRV